MAYSFHAEEDKEVRATSEDSVCVYPDIYCAGSGPAVGKKKCLLLTVYKALTVSYLRQMKSYK
ncbi:MAG: hypothetical protein K2P23_16365, partial [Lachnospiraceae bacterium]|nr:hypothetical protein [Lachnospiraceae bacterium]